MSYPATVSVPGVAASVPSTIIAGSVLPVVLSFAGTERTADTFGTSLFRIRVESEDEPIWGGPPLGEWHADALASSDLAAFEEDGSGTRTRTRARTFRVPTSSAWRGVLILTILVPDRQPMVTPVSLAPADEAEQLRDAIGALLLREPETFRVANPTQGTDTFQVSSLMRDIGSLAEEASAFVGPVIRVNVRSHQESLAVMGGFESRAPQFLMGSVGALQSDMLHLMAAVRNRLDEPAPLRLAHQTLIRRGLRSDIPAGTVIFLEVSVPRERSVAETELAALVTELVRFTDSSTWDFRARWEENRIRVFARVGPFAAAGGSDQAQTSLLNL